MTRPTAERLAEIRAEWADPRSVIHDYSCLDVYAALADALAEIDALTAELASESARADYECLVCSGGTDHGRIARIEAAARALLAAEGLPTCEGSPSCASRATRRYPKASLVLCDEHAGSRPEDPALAARVALAEALQP